MKVSTAFALAEQRRAALAQRMPVWHRLTMGDWLDLLATQYAEREHIYTSEKVYTYAESCQIADRLEGVKAFNEKRQPRWRGG